MDKTVHSEYGYGIVTNQGPKNAEFWYRNCGIRNFASGCPRTTLKTITHIELASAPLGQNDKFQK